MTTTGPQTQSLNVFVASLDTRRVGLTVKGDLDAFSVGLLDQRIVEVLNRSDTTEIELDLAGVEFVDAAATVHLRRLHQLAADSGCTLTISAATRFAWWLFASIGLTSVFPAPDEVPLDLGAPVADREPATDRPGRQRGN